MNLRLVACNRDRNASPMGLAGSLTNEYRRNGTGPEDALH